jgi:hypothetical protein
MYYEFSLKLMKNFENGTKAEMHLKGDSETGNNIKIVLSVALFKQ